MRFFRRRSHSPVDGAASATAPASHADGFLALVQSLAAASAERFKAQLEADGRREELELRRHEYDVQNAEVIARAAANAAEAKEKLRVSRRDSMRTLRASRGASKSASDCPVCQQPSDPRLTATDIAHHYAGHPSQQALALKNNAN